MPRVAASAAVVIMFFFFLVCLCVSFLSSLLTAVLAHHLAWVFTVARQHSADGSGRHGKHPSKSVSRNVWKYPTQLDIDIEIHREAFTLSP